MIYTSLRHKDFFELIRREVERVCAGIRERFGVEVTIDQSVHDLIHRNGVFPVQGVRPVFSSVAEVLDNNLAKLLFRAILAGDSRIALAYDETAQSLQALVGAETVNWPPIPDVWTGSGKAVPPTRSRMQRCTSRGMP